MMGGYQAGIAMTPELLAQQQASSAERMMALQTPGMGGYGDAYTPQPMMGGQQYQLGGQQMPPWMMGGGQQGMSPYGPPPWAQAPWMQQPQQQPQGPNLQTMQQTQATMPQAPAQPQRSPLSQVQQNMMNLKARRGFMNPNAFRNRMGNLFQQRQFNRFGR